MKTPKVSGTLKITIIYGVVFTLWIFFRNRIFYLCGKNVIYSRGQTIIDLVSGFVIALSIYFLIQYFRNKLLKETNELTNIIDNTSAVIFAKRRDGRYFFINQKFETIFHYKKEDVIGKTDFELWPEYAEKFTSNDKAVLEAGKSMVHEEPAPEEGNTQIFLSIKFPISDLSGNVYAIGGIATDITKQKRIEKELENSLALLKATLESTADGILVVDKDGNIREKNQQFLDMWKIPKELDRSQDDSKLLEFVLNQLQSPHKFLEKVNALYKKPKEESFDMVKFKDGRIFERYSKPQISGEEIIGRVWSFRDVTDRIKIEEKDKERVAEMTRFQETALALTEIKMELSINEKIDLFLELTSKAMKVERVSVWFYNELQSEIHCNKVYILSENKFIPGNTLYKNDYPNYFKSIQTNPVINADDARTDPRTSEFAKDYLSRFKITSILDTPIRVGGRVIGILCQEHTGPKRTWSHEEQVFSSSLAGIVAVSIEHDQRQKAEIKIRQSEERYRFLAEAVPQLLWTAQPSGIIDFYNSRVSEYTGKSFDELDQEWANLVHPDDVEVVQTLYQLSLVSGEPWQIEYRILGKDKKYRWFLGSAAPQKNNDGEIIKWFGSLTDINEQKESIELVKHKNAELIKINNDLDNFIYTASHDLKAPIANIEGLLNTLISSLGEFKEKGDISIVINMMTESIEKFKNVLLDLTEISKAQRNDADDIEKCSFAEIIDEIKNSIAPEIKASNAIILADLKACPEIFYSRKNLRSILYNLISNAIKYRSPERDIIVNIKTEIIDHTILLTVEDNGLGIRSDAIGDIFKMFKRFHTHVTGSGVGLYIVKRIVENAGGTIKVESEVGKGTTFKIYLKK